MKFPESQLIAEEIAALFRHWSGIMPVSITKLPGSGSNRSYFRVKGGALSVIGTWNDDLRENHAFFTFTRHFFNAGLPVPELFFINSNQKAYLQSDLGDDSLFSILSLKREEHSQFPDQILEYYKNVLLRLPEFQITSGKTLDYTACYPRQHFDRQSMMWDLNYFKYYFLKLSGIPYEEQPLEDVFNKLCDLLIIPGYKFFLYRDFQSRNIIIFKNKPYFIDYQGGRKGALQYDLASLLYDGKANLPDRVRDELLGFYLHVLDSEYKLNPDIFLRTYPAFILIRILQALGSYGFRGYYEKKAHFLSSIPFALKNLRNLRSAGQLNLGLDYLMELIDNMVDEKSQFYLQLISLASSPAKSDTVFSGKDQFALTVRIASFSYKKKIPADPTDNGGGFVFDCRALPNPGRYDQFKEKTGKDQEVIDFLKNEASVKSFLENVCFLVEQSISNYLERGFNHLMISFGCTGGQHRSVYCAEQLAGHLRKNSRLKIVLIHTEQTEHRA